MSSAVSSELPPQRGYEQRVAQLNRASVRKYYRAFHDIDWEAPEHVIARNDARFALRAGSPLAQSAWYRALPAPQRAALGLEYVCQTMKYGIGFEGVLSAGLLRFARQLPNRTPSYRYALHELIEECQHSMMFQEFIDRSGCDPQPVSGPIAFFDRWMARMASIFPALFFFAVLAGELFIDSEQRAWLKEETSRPHPLLRRVMQIHVTEEARHIAFAELYLEREIPRLAGWQRGLLRFLVPILLRGTQTLMFEPNAHLVRAFGIPRDVLRACYGHGSAHRERVESLAQPILALLPGGESLRVFPR